MTVLCVMHDLEQMGASFAFLNIIELLQQNQTETVVMTLKDGPLRETLEAKGIPVLIQTNWLQNYEILLKQAALFDLIIVNSLVCFEAVHVLKYSKTRVLWWIDENGQFITGNTNLLPDFARLPDNITVYANSTITQNDIYKVYGRKVELLPLGISDRNLPRHNYDSRNKKCGRIVIGNIGTFALLKGQDILIKALEGLDTENQERYEMVFVGRVDPYHSEIVEDTYRFIEDRENVTCYDWMEQEKLYDLMRTWDLLVVPSRLESLSAVAIEAMAMEIPVLCSSACGISQYIENEKTGWIFESENVEQLQEILQNVLRQPEILEQVGKQGRGVYVNYFSRKALENILLPIIERN